MARGFKGAGFTVERLSLGGLGLTGFWISGLRVGVSGYGAERFQGSCKQSADNPGESDEWILSQLVKAHKNELTRRVKLQGFRERFQGVGFRVYHLFVA